MLIESHGVRFELRCSERALLERSRVAWPPATTSPSVVEGGASDHGYEVVRDGESFALRRDGDALWRGEDEAELWKALRDDLEIEVSRSAPDAAFIHAGAVAWGGRCIVIPGRSMSGKTTLTAALLSAGCAYLSDEFAVIDAAGMVRPFARTLRLRSDVGSIERAASSFAATTVNEPLPLAIVVASTFESGARFAPRVGTRGEAMVALIDNAVAVRERPRMTLDLIDLALRDARALFGPRGDADEAAALIIAACERP